MANKRYSEEDGEANLAEKVKGKKDTEGAAYKDFSSPDGSGDEARWPGHGEGKVGADVPADNPPKGLPKAGKLS